MQKTSRFSRLLTLVTAVALAVCLPVSAYAETETTEEAAAPAVVEEATQDNTADEAASEDSASCVRVVDVTIFMDITKGHFESDPDNVALTYLNRAEFEETPITLPTVIANEGWEFKGWDVWGKEHFVLGADATELGTSGLGAFPVGSLVGGIYLYPIFMEAPKPTATPTATPVEPTATPTATPVEPTATPTATPVVTPTTPVTPETTPTATPVVTPTSPVTPETTPTTTPVVTPTTPVIPETTPTNTPANTPTEKTNTPDNTPTNTPDVTKSNTPADNSSKIIPQTGVSSTNSNSVAGLVIVLVAALGGAAAYLFINRKKLN